MTAIDLDIPSGKAVGLRGLLPFVASQSRIMILTVCSGIVAQIAMMATLATGAWLVGHALGGFSGGSFAIACAMLTMCLLLSAIARWQQTFQGHDLAFALVETLQIGIYEGLERAAPRYVLGRRTGDLAAIAMADAQLMEWFYAHLLGDYVGAALVPLVALAILAWIDPLAALVLLPFIPLVASVPFWLARRAGIQGESLRRELGTLNAEIVEGIQGLREIAIFDYGPSYLKRLSDRSKAIHGHQFRYGSRSGLEQAAIDLLLALALLSVLGAGIWLVEMGRLDMALLPMVVVIAGAALAPVTQVTETARKLGELRASASRVLTIFHQDAQVRDNASAAPALATPHIAFDRVRFSYDEGGTPVLRDISFEVKPGETVALVGESGAGKSTCINLLMRFWDVNGGDIQVGGQNIKSVPIRSLREWITIVPQDTYLFNMPVKENIRLGTPEATDSEIEKAARFALADDFICALPDGYNTICGERGARLSGGQRQRIAIARAFLRNAPILLMDEAVSNLDTENETALQGRLQELRQGKATLIVAHRLSTIRSADRILVLEKGRIVEEGHHDELIARQGRYAALVASATDGIIPDQAEVSRAD